MKIKDGFVLESVGGSFLAVAVGERTKSFSGLVRMNATGAFFWGLAKDKDVSAEELVLAAMKEYDAPREVIERDVAAFREKLLVAGILEE